MFARHAASKPSVSRRCKRYGERGHWMFGDRRSRIERTVLDASMAQPPSGTEPTGPGADAPAVPMPPAELDQARRTSMAAERTWLAWWRSALAASAGALGV